MIQSKSFADHEDAITRLATCMSANDNASLQLEAIRVLVNLASYQKDDLVRVKIAAQIVQENGAIAGFVKNLSANYDMQKQTAVADLASLAEVDGATVKQRTIDEDDAIPALVDCLSSTSFRLKREATRALQSITNGRGACWFVIDDHDLQEGALGFFDDLWDHDSVKESFADHEDAITRLATCMSATDNASLQLQAIMVLVNLASYQKDDLVRKKIAAQIFQENGAIAGFVKNLSANYDMQKQTVVADLASLAEVDGATVKQRTIDVDDAIPALVDCLCSTSFRLKREATRALQSITNGRGACWFVIDDHDLQEGALGFLDDLWDHDSVKESFADHEVAITRLATCMSATDNASLQLEAIRVLVNLASYRKDDLVRQKIVAQIFQENGAIAGFVKNLSANYDMQKQTVVADLASLAEVDGATVKQRTIDVDDAIPALVDCLCSTSFRLKREATRALQSITNGRGACWFVIDDHDLQEGALGFLDDLWDHDSVKESFADHEVAITRLATCMSATDNASLQLEAIRVLVNLASYRKDDLVREKIAAQIFQENGAIAGFVKNLSANYDMQKQTVVADLASLAEVDGATVKQRTIDEDDAISALVDCLCSMSFRLKCEATRALQSITNGRGACWFVIDDHDLQEGALGFLDDLWDHDSVKESFADHEDAITGLATCMSATDNASLQPETIRVLVNLASYRKDDLVRKKIAAQIFQENGAIAGFVKNLSANYDMQKQTVVADLASLAEVDGATVKQRTIDEDDAISTLVDCLCSTSFRLKREATRALQSITKRSGACWKRRKIVPKL